MDTPDYAAMVARHRDCFLSGRTRPEAWRQAQLQALKAMLDEHHDEFCDALWTDLRRNRVDADLVDVANSAKEAEHALAHLRAWMAPQRMHVPVLLQPGRAEVRFDPLGVALIIGAWNYPIYLVLAPLVPAIAAGNAAVLKPSELSPACAEALARRIPDYLDQDAFSVVLGGVPETTALLEQKFDKIFFTGGPPVGKVVMAAAAKHLTPVALELGGKNPTIVHSSADLRVAARRIAHGRFVNAGQTCTAPDHVLVFSDVAPAFLDQLRTAIIEFYGEDPQQSPDYGRIVNDHHHDRLSRLLGSGRVLVGGRTDKADRYIAPTVLVDVAPDAPVMQEEVFGPILPVLEVGSVEAVIAQVRSRPRPLGLYVFTEDKAVAEQILAATASGDACINDCAVQPLVPELPFGGVGNSGFGKYHGQWGFREFVNPRGVLDHSTMLDPGVRYPPYSENQTVRALLGRWT